MDRILPISRSGDTASISTVTTSVQVAVIACITLVLVTAVAFGFVVREASRNPPRTAVPHDTPSTSTPDAEVGYVLKPNISFHNGAGVPQEYFINDRGFRVGQPNQKAPVHAEILLAGCSQAFGQSVPYDATFAAVLGQKLNMTVANLGVPGYGGISSVLLARRFKDLQPSLLVYGFWEDHVYRNLAKCINSHAPFCISLPYFSCREGVCRVSPPADNANSMRLTQGYTRDLGQGRDSYGFTNDVYWTGRLLIQQLLLNAGLADKYVEVSDQRSLRAATFAFFDLVVKETKGLGAKPIVVFIPYYFDDVIHETPEYVIDAAQKNGVHLVTLTDRFRQEVAAHPGSLAVPGDGHLSERAHRLIADAIAEHVAGVE